MNRLTLDVNKEHACDVLVVGGGVSGIASAICAARQGAGVILCETGGFLGGTATKGLVGPFMTCYDHAGENRIIRGFFAELVDRLIAENGAISYEDCPGCDSYSGYRLTGHIGVTPFSAEIFKRVVEEMCLEAGVRLFYHSRLIACDTVDSVIQKAYFATVSGIEAITAKVFIDTTGSATLAHYAGAETFRGDEEGFVQTASLFFQIRGVDKAVLDAYMEKNREPRKRFFMDEIVEARKVGKFPCGTYKFRIFEGLNGIWTVNMAQEDDQVNELDSEALTMAEIRQRKQIPALMAFLKETIPGCESIELLTSASDLGVRESRRIVGKVMLMGEDLQKSNYKEEQIAVCANSMDVHTSTGVSYLTHTGNNYYIPLGSLISKNIKNLMAAGKNVSADKFAFSAIRVMTPCFAMGQAAGITAALAAKADADVASVDVKEVQKLILKNGGYLEC